MSRCTLSSPLKNGIVPYLEFPGTALRGVTCSLGVWTDLPLYITVQQDRHHNEDRFRTIARCAYLLLRQCFHGLAKHKVSEEGSVRLCYHYKTRT